MCIMNVHVRQFSSSPHFSSCLLSFENELISEKVFSCSCIECSILYKQAFDFSLLSISLCSCRPTSFHIIFPVFLLFIFTSFLKSCYRKVYFLCVCLRSEMCVCLGACCSNSTYLSISVETIGSGNSGGRDSFT